MAKRFTGSSPWSKGLLVAGLRVDIDDDGEFLFEGEFDDRVELFHEGGAVGLFALPGEERVGVDA
jgi:hypothetical protein